MLYPSMRNARPESARNPSFEQESHSDSCSRREANSGKVFVVTGASKGIGLAIAKHFAAEDAAVSANYSTGKTDAGKVIGKIVAKGGSRRLTTLSRD